MLVSVSSWRDGVAYRAEGGVVRVDNRGSGDGSISLRGRDSRGLLTGSDGGGRDSGGSSILGSSRADDGRKGREGEGVSHLERVIDGGVTKVYV